VTVKQGMKRFGELRAMADAGECPFDGLAGCARGSCRLFGDEMRAFEACPAWKKQDAETVVD
jgi:hypothetical protein